MKKVQVGEIYARLTVVEEHPERDKWGSRMVWCICSCGNPERVLKKAYLLRNGQCKSCGCLQKENFSLQGKLSADEQVAFKYEHTKHLIENDGSAIWSSEKLTLNGVDYKCGMWHTLNEELKQYLNSYMNC